MSYTFVFVLVQARRQDGIAYGDLIDLYESADVLENEHLFIKIFSESFPTYHLSRPKRFIDTVQRIVAPTRPSLRGPPKLCGSPLLSYRKRTWNPKIPNPEGSSSGGDYYITCMHAATRLQYSTYSRRWS